MNTNQISNNVNISAANTNKILMFGTSKTGRTHNFKQVPCQDRFIILEPSSGIYVMAVADGASGSDNPCQAAEVNISVAQTIATQRQFWEMSEKAFTKNIAKLFRERLIETGFELDELCATVAFVMIDSKTGDCICFSVGDSSILSFDNMLNFRPVTHPINGLDKSYTVFTNYKRYVEKYAYCRKLKLSPGVCGFLVYTDGADQLAAGSYYDAQQVVSGMILGHTDVLDAMTNHIAGVNADDITFCGGYVPSDNLRTAAEAIYENKIAAEPVQVETEAVHPDTNATRKTDPAMLPDSDDNTSEAETPAAQEKTRHYVPKRKPVKASADMNGKTRRYTAPAPASMKTPAQNPPALLSFLDTPRTAAEIIGEGIGFDRENFMVEMLVFMRTGLISCSEIDGKVMFRRAA